MNSISNHHSKNHEIANPKINFLSHCDYKAQVRRYLQQCAKRDTDFFKEHYKPLLQVYLLDLEPLFSQLSVLYSPKLQGQRAIDPSCILRSLLLMTAFGIKSPRSWEPTVKLNPVLAVFSGFQPEDCPCYGTYYKFKKRLENGPYQRPCKHIVLESDKRKAMPALSKPKKKPTEKGDKTKTDPKGVLESLLEKLRSTSEEPVPKDLENRLNEMLMEIAVKPSSQRGLLGEKSELSMSGDGSTLPSGASSCGKPTCDCKKDGIFKCDHPRKFSDPHAQWGWDNREKDFVFGYRFYQFVCGSKGHDLPLYVSIAPANAYEGSMFLNAIDRFRKQIQELYPELKINKVALDAIHDAHAIYKYLDEKQILSAIPYAKKPAKCVFLGDRKQPFNQKGLPLCKANLPMRLHSVSKHGHRVYVCPVKRAARKGGKLHYVSHVQECPLKSLCEPNSPLGPYVRVRGDVDLRIHCNIPRGSEEYRTLLKSRTCTERSNSAKKEFYQLKYTKTRVMPYAHIRLFLASVLEHSRSWVKEMFKGVKDPKEKALEFVLNGTLPAREGDP